MMLPRPLSWSEWLAWVWHNQPQRYREPARPVLVKPIELPKDVAPTQERFL